MKWLLCLLMLLPVGAWAQEAGFIYSRETAQIVPKPKKGEEPDEKKELHSLDIELLPFRNLQEADSFHLSVDAERGMLASLPDGLSQIQTANLYVPIDLVVLNAEGAVTRVWPGIVLSELRKPLVLPQGSVALLLLAPETARKKGLVPGAVLRHSGFAEDPVVLK